MYHYYVRYSFYNEENGKVGDGDIGIEMEHEISQMSDIWAIKKKILDICHQEKRVTVKSVFIDFYALLRKDPD